jgi:hypothetical protein
MLQSQTAASPAKDLGAMLLLLLLIILMFSLEHISNAYVIFCMSHEMHHTEHRQQPLMMITMRMATTHLPGKVCTPWPGPAQAEMLVLAYRYRMAETGRTPLSLGFRDQVTSKASYCICM